MGRVGKDLPSAGKQYVVSSARKSATGTFEARENWQTVPAKGGKKCNRCQA